jgi:hypothetical protein
MSQSVGVAPLEYLHLQMSLEGAALDRNGLLVPVFEEISIEKER